mmetsp:Transcript_46802/g.151042  ORF Transcript_46802/g.151042 Transcript_46802/m.151042 type:complete len:302 (+) Transcript_46802:568-1473(+)
MGHGLHERGEHGAADGGGERRGSGPRGGLPLLALCRRAGRAVGRRGGRREELVEELLRPPAQVDPRPKVELPARGRRRRRRRRGLEGRGRERRRRRGKARRVERLRQLRRQRRVRRQRWQRRQRSRLQRATHPEGDHAPGSAGHSKQARNSSGRGRRVAQQHQLWSDGAAQLVDDAMRWPQGRRRSTLRRVPDATTVLVGRRRRLQRCVDTHARGGDEEAVPLAGGAESLPKGGRQRFRLCMRPAAGKLLAPARLGGRLPLSRGSRRRRGRGRWCGRQRRIHVHVVVVVVVVCCASAPAPR